MQPPGPTREAVRNKKTKEMAKERSAAKAQRPIGVVQPDGTVAVEKYGDVDHQSKKAKVDGMRSVIDKNRVDAIMSQISVMRSLEEVYVGRPFSPKGLYFRTELNLLQPRDRERTQWKGGRGVLT